MEDFFNFEAVAYERAKPARQVRASSTRGSRGDRPELATGEPIDIYHWAAVALVTALMCAVLGYAAGTPALSRAANVTSFVFGAMGMALMASGVVRSLRTRIATGERLVVPVVKTH
ncbi:hypothetical protein [Caballeronia insecticola]|uniref:Uncharacterized protein n=1 Tax=Caballeronia insecticola TaxID=758793 RepID=R4WG08_9BURK|nr:hypothetical protein [Caballeronia insecticola]BAN22589.1 hypothetical protein BRPE64_ACDS08350 [Caballeronia insecticola]